MKRTALLALPVLALAACSGGADSPASTPAGLTLTTYTDQLIAGAYTDGVVSLTLSSQEIATGIVVTQVNMDELSYKLTVDYNSGQLEFLNPSSAANGEQVSALRALETELAFMTPEGKAATNVEHTLRAAATLLSDAAVGEVLPTVQATINRSVVNIGCGNYCRTLYGTPGYGGSSTGCNVYKQTGQNSSNCKGRCGAGCGGTRTGSSDQWTMDCAEHDYQIGPWSDCTDDVLTAPTVSCGTHSGCFCAGNCNSQDNCANNAGGCPSGGCI